MKVIFSIVTLLKVIILTHKFITKNTKGLNNRNFEGYNLDKFQASYDLKYHTSDALLSKTTSIQILMHYCLKLIPCELFIDKFS